jgi:2'-5' RNA ligase
LNQGIAGLYVSCSYDDATVENLVRWAEQHQIPAAVAGETLHSTVVYSRNLVTQEEIDVLDLNLNVDYGEVCPVDLTPIGFQLFSSQDGTRSILVIVLSAPYLTDLHQRLVAQGATHDFEDYVPHVTMSYNVPSDLDLSSLSLPEFSLRVAGLRAEPLNFDWTA